MWKFQGSLKQGAPLVICLQKNFISSLGVKGLGAKQFMPFSLSIKKKIFSAHRLNILPRQYKMCIHILSCVLYNQACSSLNRKTGTNMYTLFNYGSAWWLLLPWCTQLNLTTIEMYKSSLKYDCTQRNNKIYYLHMFHKKHCIVVRYFQ